MLREPEHEASNSDYGNTGTIKGAQNLMGSIDNFKQLEDTSGLHGPPEISKFEDEPIELIVNLNRKLSPIDLR